MNVKNYDYFLPQKNLALKPAVPRDFSKIFVYDIVSDKIYFDRFLNLDKYLPEKSFLVLNNTKVLPARAVLFKENGGKLEILFFVNESNEFKNQMVKGLVDRKAQIGQKVFFDKKHFLKIINQKEKIFYFKLNFSFLKFLKLLEKYGNPPIPLYLRKTPLKKDKLAEKYQTIFAKKKGSIAAPTASLHFTNRVFKKLKKKGIKKYFITLHVGAGTFAPVTEENLKLKKLHEEYFEIEKKNWQAIIKEKAKGRKLTAVGTTVVRALETFAREKTNPQFRGQKSKTFRKTNLFIFPPFEFRMVDCLITNFHLPKSSLMMLVSAFLEFKGAKRGLVDLYNIAIKNNFRFYSFGDSMLLK